MVQQAESGQAAEFDQFASRYSAMHAANIAVSGEAPEFFAEYKIADLAAVARGAGVTVDRIVDFGAGVGNAVPWFRKYFPAAHLTLADVSQQSLDVAKSRFPGSENYARIAEERLPLPDASVDLAFAACVFHHIPAGEHIHWLEELKRVTRPGGLVAIFEHNPWNPLTVRIVNDCPFDANAVLITQPALAKKFDAAGLKVVARAFRIFFPGALAALRPLERWLKWAPVGGQYYLVGQRSP